MTIALALIAASVAAMWPALYNRQPIFFPDTTAYIRGADAGMQKLLKRSTAWSKPSSFAAPTAQAGDSPATASPGSTEPAVLSGRSVYYGALLYVGDVFGGMWLSVAVQAMVLVLTVTMVFRAFGATHWRPISVALSALVLFSPVPLFVSFLMPDIFAGIVILTCAMLLARSDALTGKALAIWTLLLLGGLLFHTSHQLLALLMLAMGAVLCAANRLSLRPRGPGLIAACLIAGYSSGLAFNHAVIRSLGSAPVGPPFLMARLIDDGPGYRYLRETCPGSGFTVCRFIERMPLHSDDFLWDSTKGVFMATDGATRRALTDEQSRFAIAVLRDQPVEVAFAMGRNIAVQAMKIGASEFNYTQQMKVGFGRKLPAGYFETMQQTHAFAGTMPVRWFSWLTYASSIIALIYIAYAMGSHYRGNAALTKPMATFVALSLAGIAANAAICGILSGPHDRYQARVIWLLPLLALLMYFSASRPALLNEPENRYRGF